MPSLSTPLITEPSKAKGSFLSFAFRVELSADKEARLAAARARMQTLGCSKKERKAGSETLASVRRDPFLCCSLPVRMRSTGTWTGATVNRTSRYRPATEVALTSRCFQPASLKSPNGWKMGWRLRHLTEMVTDNPCQLPRAKVRAARTSPRSSTISAAGGHSFSGLSSFKRLELPAFVCLWPGWVCRTLDVACPTRTTFWDAVPCAGCLVECSICTVHC